MPEAVADRLGTEKSDGHARSPLTKSDGVDGLAADVARIELTGRGILQQSRPRPSIALDTAPSLAFTTGPSRRRLLYTCEERRRRDASVWTLVQGILAPVQFLIFLVSLVLVLRYLATGAGLPVANASVVVKTIALYTIMITGSIWEREVFGRFLFAHAFFWEDVFSMLVLALHTAYLAGLATHALQPHTLMLLALAAYASYVVNATQFLLKLRAARLDSAHLDPAHLDSAELPLGAAT